MYDEQRRIGIAPRIPSEYKKSHRGSRSQILLGVSAAAFLGPFTQTVYAPSLLEIGADLHVNTMMVNLTISIFTAILAVSSFVVGPLADSRGRRTVLLPGLALFIAGSLVCLLAQSYALFLVGRIIQACGISVGSVIAAAVIGDIYPPDERSHAMSVNQLVVFLGPVFGPVIGGLVASYLHWQWAFGVLIVAGIIVLLFDQRLLPETLSGSNEGSRLTLDRIRTVVRNRSARSILFLGFSQFYGYYEFLVFLPMLSERFGLSTAEKGLVFVPLTAGILAGITVAKRWLGHWQAARIIRVASYAIAVNVLALWLLLATDTLSLPLLAASMLLYGMLLGASLPAQSTMLVNLFRHDRATAMGIYNFTRFMGASAGPMLGAIFVSSFGNATMLLSLGLLLLISAYAIERSMTPQRHAQR